MKLFWAVLAERAGAANYVCFNSMLDVAMVAGRNGYSRISSGYTRTDDARNGMIEMFLSKSTEPDDMLVMMDGDHKYPLDILEQFADLDPALGVVGALAYRRGAPFDPLFFFRGEDGGLHTPLGFERGPVYQCAMITTSCIAIRRHVLDSLIREGFKLPFFRYTYNEETGVCPSEDVYFSAICEKAGIPVYCHTGIEIPHATIDFITADTRAKFEDENEIPAMDVLVSANGN